MLYSKLKQVLLGGAAATTLLLSPYAAQAGNITVYVAANFTGTAKLLLDRFVSSYAGATYSLAGGSTGNLVTAITQGGNYSTGGVTYTQADLFFAANTTAITSSLAAYTGTGTTAIVQPSGYDPAGTTSTHYGWIYAQGYLELLSKTAGDVTANGLTDIWTNPTSYTQTPALVIANPKTAPYGAAALQVLDSTFGFTYTTGSTFTTTGTQGVVTASDIGVTYNDVASGTFAWGFVALSAIATYDALNLVLNYSTTLGTNHYSYVSGEDYNPILQGAAKINGPGDHTLRDAFVAWLGTRDAQAIILHDGYTIPVGEVLLP